MTFQHWAGVSSYTSSFDLAETCVFVKQLLGPFLCDLILLRLPFSRSYGVILPNSLTMLLPSALGFSPHPPVSVYGTGTVQTIAAFLGSRLTHFPTLVRYASHLWVARRFFQPYPSCACPWIPFQVVLSFCVPTVLLYCSTGISTCCPSATPLGLALGPDFPRADQLYPGNLGYSAWRIPTSISLLIPAFSLLKSPQLLTGTASLL